jgi:ribonuclease Y
MTITNLLIALGFLLLGALICYLIFRFNSKGILRKAEEEAEVIKKNKIIEAKEKFIALKLEHENQVRQAEQKLHQQEQRQQQREQQLNQKQGEVQRAQNELNTQRQALENQQKAIEHKTQEIERLQQKAEQQLEQISGLSAEEAKKQLVDALKDEAKTAAMAYINDTMD